MGVRRRHLTLAGIVVLGAAGLVSGAPSFAQAGDEAAVKQAVEALRKAMIAGDRAQLEALVADQLSYGHSGGVVETKQQFVDIVSSKKTVYKTITLSDDSVVVAGSNAIARHVFSVEFETEGKPGAAKVGVMQVWTKQGTSWKLLARQAFRTS
ncbi:MAG TPA: nuclear transport factor 2 family protein [Vineibacter sp.]|nr:nuclear transport factor 2 family protein [Vineibacter sp.]